MDIKEVNLDALDMKYERLRTKEPLREKRLLASLGELGQQSPIIVVRAGEIGRYIVIDGHKRARALRKLRADTAKSVIWDIMAPEALILAYRMTSGSGYNALEEGWLIYELCRTCAWSLDEAAKAFNRSKGWASRRLGLVESLPEIVLDGVQKGKIGAYVAAKYLLPLARANAQDCEKLAQAVSQHGLTSRQAEIIYLHYTQGPKSAAAKIIEDPVRFLKAHEQAGRRADNPDLSPLENRCLKNLGLVGSISLGLARSLPEAVSYDTAQTAKDKLRRHWQSALERFGLLEKTAQALFVLRQAQEPTHA